MVESRKKYKDVEGIAVVLGWIPLVVSIGSGVVAWALLKSVGFNWLSAIPVVVTIALCVIMAALGFLTLIMQGLWPALYNSYAYRWNVKRGFEKEH